MDADVIEKEGKGARGKTELLKHLRGEPLGLRGAVYAKCYDCCGFMIDGREDCKVPDCSLYPYMPYSSAKKVSGKVGKKLSPEHLAKMQAARALKNPI